MRWIPGWLTIAVGLVWLVGCPPAYTGDDDDFGDDDASAGDDDDATADDDDATAGDDDDDDDATTDDDDDDACADYRTQYPSGPYGFAVGSVLDDVPGMVDGQGQPHDFAEIYADTSKIVLVIANAFDS